MKNKRLLSAVLAFLTVTSALISCGDAAQPQTQETKPAKEETEALSGGDETETVEDIYGRAGTKDSLPDDIDFEGKEIRVITRAGDYDTSIEFLAESETGDVVQDAVYRRNLSVSERLNIKMTVLPQDSTRHDGGVINGLVSKSVLGGSDDYDLVSNHSSQTTPSIIQGYYQNLLELPYLDWEKPWWNQSHREAITMSGKQFMCAGEIGLTMISGTYLLFFNKSLWGTNFGDDNLYEIVREGTWTMDRMAQYCTEIYRDLNGNGQADEEDLFGNVYNKEDIQGDAMAGGANLTFAAYDESSGYYVWALENDRTAKFLEKAKTLLHTNNNTYLAKCSFSVDLLDKLKNDTALFTIHMLSGTELLRDMESDYGIIPQPKLEETDEAYTTFTHNGFSVFAIPITCGIPEEVAAFIEATAAENYRTVTPAYYDVALKVKYARDEDACEMMDICTNSIYFDFAMLYNQYISTSTALFRAMLTTTTNIDKGMSTIAKRTKNASGLMKKLIDAYAELD